MINLKVSASTLCELMRGTFTLQACEALCELLEDCAPGDSFTVGDLAVSFSELPGDYITDYNEDETMIIHLDNGNILVAN